MIPSLATSAPGKLMISGEYVVLTGAVAVVASVGVRVYARWYETSPASAQAVAQPGLAAGLPREAICARELAERAFGVVPATLDIDVRELRKAGLKLGLGSSAAAAAAAVGAVATWHGRSLDDPEVQAQVLALALAGHKAIAPEGSGADVAAASLGGFVRFQLRDGEPASAQRIAWPESLLTHVVWTGKEARTSEFVRAVRAFEARDAHGYGVICDTMRSLAQHFADAIAAHDISGIITTADDYGQAMGRLGELAEVPIVTPELAQIAALARAHGGAAKPSGAGGGDVAVAFFGSNESAKAFATACRAQNLGLLDLGLGAPGVRIELT